MSHHTRYRGPTLIAVAVSLALAACAGAPQKSVEAADARARLTVLQSDANLASHAPVAIKEAETAVVAAEARQSSEEQKVHLVYLADRKVGTARALAEAGLAEDQRAKLGEQREKLRLAARTHEADVARAEVATARADAVEQRRETEVLRSNAEVARVQAAADADAARAQASSDAVAARAAAESEASELQRQIDELQARPTDRGLVLTLGDVLFTSGKSDLNASATGSLERLTSFLNRYPDRSVAIEGHTDSNGGDDYNLALSQRRAESVKDYLTGHGIGSMRLAASGMGESQPLAGNDSATGRQQNRRVEVIIANPPTALK
jgi:outer membrane protein OmpA-like peptidoglycan-associated protein